MTKARIEANEKQANWKNRLLIKDLREQGLSYQQIANFVSKSRTKKITRAAVYEINKKIKNITKEELRQKVAGFDGKNIEVYSREVPVITSIKISIINERPLL